MGVVPMRPGPPPRPTALKVFRGNPGKGRLNAAEPVYPPASAVPPVELVPLARAIWDAHAPPLIGQGILQVVDARLFATYCRLQALGEALLVTAENVASTKAGVWSGVKRSCQ